MVAQSSNGLRIEQQLYEALSAKAGSMIDISNDICQSMKSRSTSDRHLSKPPAGKLKNVVSDWPVLIYTYPNAELYTAIKHNPEFIVNNAHMKNNYPT